MWLQHVDELIVQWKDGSHHLVHTIEDHSDTDTSPQSNVIWGDTISIVVDTVKKDHQLFVDR